MFLSAASLSLWVNILNPCYLAAEFHCEKTGYCAFLKVEEEEARNFLSVIFSVESLCIEGYYCK